MSANLTLDLGNTTYLQPSITPAAGVAGTPSSGEIVGKVVDLIYANTYCNLVVMGSTSGPFRVQVQSSDTNTSGSFVDATSGLGTALPGPFLSGGILVVNSGLWASGQFPAHSQVDNAPWFASGGMAAGAFQRQHRYVRARVLSGDVNVGPVTCAFVSQAKYTGSGFGYTLSPSSGAINV